MKDHTTATIHLSGGKSGTVIAQPTDTPGIVVTPALTHYGLTGHWNLTHAASGMVIPIEGYEIGVDMHTAVRVGDALGQVPIDWTLDRDALKQAYDNDEIKAKVRQVVRGALYPPADPDAGVAGPGEYPKTSDQVTADAMAASYVQTALETYAIHWELLRASHTDKPAMAVYVSSVAAMLAEYGIAHLLREFAKADQQAADHAARELWEAFDAGDSIGEFLSQWGREYGVPTPTEEEVTAELEQRKGLTFPPPAGYDTVLNWALPYGEGTIRTLREQIAKVAAMGEQRFGDITEQWMAISRNPASGETPPDSFGRDHMIAHGASFYGWSLVAILGWLAKEYPTLARRAAAMVDDIGNNGGNSYCEDVNVDGDDGDGEQAPTDTKG